MVSPCFWFHIAEWWSSWYPLLSIFQETLSYSTPAFLYIFFVRSLPHFSCCTTTFLYILWKSILLYPTVLFCFSLFEGSNCEVFVLDKIILLFLTSMTLTAFSRTLKNMYRMLDLLQLLYRDKLCFFIYRSRATPYTDAEVKVMQYLGSHAIVSLCPAFLVFMNLLCHLTWSTGTYSSWAAFHFVSFFPFIKTHAGHITNQISKLVSILKIAICKSYARI